MTAEDPRGPLDAACAALFDGVDSGLLLVEPGAGRILAANEAWTRSWGLTQGELVDRTQAVEPGERQHDLTRGGHRAAGQPGDDARTGAYRSALRFLTASLFLEQKKSFIKEMEIFVQELKSKNWNNDKVFEAINQKLKSTRFSNLSSDTFKNKLEIYNDSEIVLSEKNSE